MNKKQITSVNKNQKINYWYNTALTLMQEKILHYCIAVIQDNFLNHLQTIDPEITSGKIIVKEFINDFNLIGKPNDRIKKNTNLLNKLMINAINPKLI